MDGSSPNSDPTAWKPASIRNQLFIDGQWVDGVDGGTIDVINPHDGSTITAIAEATAPDVDKAVAAAQKAFPAWSRMAAMDRGRLLLKLADRIEEDMVELGRLESLKYRPSVSRYADPGRPAHRHHLPLFRRHGGQVRRFRHPRRSRVPQLSGA